MLNDLERAILDQLRPTPDPVDFAGQMGIALQTWQQDVLRCKDQAVLLNCSRQAGKSTVTAVLACHTAMFNSDKLILVVSKALRQATNLGSTIRKLFKELRRPPVFLEENKTSLTLANGSRIISLPGNEATIRGFSAVDLLIEDEASRVPDALNSAVTPMLAVSRGRLFMLSTPWGKRGHFYKAWAEGGDDYRRFRVSHDMCPHIPKDYVAKERRKGEWWYRQEFCCEFMDTENQVFASAVVDRAVKPEVQAMRFT